MVDGGGGEQREAAVAEREQVLDRQPCAAPVLAPDERVPFDAGRVHHHERHSALARRRHARMLGGQRVEAERVDDGVADAAALRHQQQRDAGFLGRARDALEQHHRGGIAERARQAAGHQQPDRVAAA